MAIFRSGKSGLLLPGTPRPVDLRDIVVPDGLVRYWPLDVDSLKSSTVVADLTGTADGTTSGSPTFSEGQIGHCYKFVGGSTRCIDTSVNAGITRFSRFTMSVWAKATQSQTGNTLVGTAIDSGALDGPWLLWAAGGIADRTLVFFGGTDTAIILARANNAKSLNVWYHIAATYDGSTSKAGLIIYENGEMVPQAGGATTNITSDPTDRPWRIGNDRSPADSEFFGFIDDVRIYNRTLSPAEVRAIYISGLQGSRDQAALGVEFSGWGDDPILQSMIIPAPIDMTSIGAFVSA